MSFIALQEKIKNKIVNTMPSIEFLRTFQFKIFRANKKGSYYTSMKLADSCLLLCPLDKLL